MSRINKISIAAYVCLMVAYYAASVNNEKVCLTAAIVGLILILAVLWLDRNPPPTDG